MTSFVWCEWICSRCGEIHRMRFDIEIGLKPTYQLKGKLFEHWNVQIRDVAFSLQERHSKRGHRTKGSKIYVAWDTQLERIFAVVAEYMKQYYAIKEDTLTLEVCRA